MIDAGLTPEEMTPAVQETLTQNQALFAEGEEAWVVPTVTRGPIFPPGREGDGRGRKGTEEGAKHGQLGNWATGQLGNQPQPLEPNFLIS
jgi:hypothetical protein